MAIESPVADTAPFVPEPAMPNRRMPFPLLTALLLIAGLSRAEPGVTVESGPMRTAVLELYTSEGCSSCPPADLYLSSIGRSDLTPERVIPLAFHVTYWDHIGWRDPFADPAHDLRQQDTAARAGTHTIYTPQMILNGRDLSDGGHLENQLKMINARKPAAHIRLELSAPQDKIIPVQVTVRIPDQEQRREAAMYLILYENGLSRHVKAGENRGQTLHHDHVVRLLYGPYRLPPDQVEYEQELRIKLPEEINTHHSGLVAFVQDVGDGEVLQAVATELPIALQ